MHLPRRGRRDLLRLMEGLVRLTVGLMGHVLRGRYGRMMTVCAIAVMVLLGWLRLMLLLLLVRVEIVRMVRLRLCLRGCLLVLLLLLRKVRHRRHLVVRRR